MLWTADCFLRCFTVSKCLVLNTTLDHLPFPVMASATATTPTADRLQQSSYLVCLSSASEHENAMFVHRGGVVSRASSSSTCGMLAYQAGDAIMLHALNCQTLKDTALLRAIGRVVLHQSTGSRPVLIRSIPTLASKICILYGNRRLTFAV
jgi:hypothetical protein